MIGPQVFAEVVQTKQFSGLAIVLQLHCSGKLLAAIYRTKLAEATREAPTGSGAP